jgi:hypothetical protein
LPFFKSFASPVFCVTRSFFLLVVLILLAGTVGATQASAQSGESDYTRNGLYVSFGGSAAFPTVLQNELNDQLVGSTDIDTGLGVEARMGYRFHPRLAAEVQYDYIREIDVRANFRGINSRVQANIPMHIVTANAKAFVLGTGQGQAYLLGGIGIMSAETKDVAVFDPDIDDTTFTGRVGVGVDVYPSENFSFYGEVGYVIPTDALQDLQHVSVSVGVTVHFR